MKRFLFAGIIIVLVVFGSWMIVIPEGLIINLIRNSIENDNLQIKIEDLKKRPFYNFTSQKIILERSGTTLLSIDDMVGRVNLLDLFLMRPTLSFNGNISGGRIAGKVDLLKERNKVDVSIDSANVDGIPLFAGIGFNGRGILSGSLSLRGGLGDLRFSIKDAKFDGRSFSGVMVPMDMFQSVRGAIAIEGDTIEVRSLLMEGKGIYARVKGNIRKGLMDLKIELMQDSSFSDKSPIFSIIENYRVSPGYYVIPIKGAV